MNTAAKRELDRWVGTPLCVALNWLAAALGWLARRNHEIGHSPSVIVICKYLGMGSVVNASGLMRALRDAYPASRIVFLGTRATCEIAWRTACIDATLAVNDAGLGFLIASAARALVRLWRLKPELFIDLEVYSKFASLIAVLSLARNRVGFFSDTTLFRKYLYTHLVYFNRYRHIREVYAGVARVLGIATRPDNGVVALRVSEAETREAERLLHAAGIGSGEGPLVVINPNAGDLCLERRWPAERFADVIRQLVAKASARIVIIGSSSEAAHVAGIVGSLEERVRARVVDAAGKLSLGGCLALLSMAELVITNDSGPYHFALAMGARTVSLWGPSTPTHYGPTSGGHAVVRAEIYCSPCLHLTDRPPCRGENLCMQLIPSEAVLEAAEALLAGRDSAERPLEVVILSDKSNGASGGYVPGVVRRGRI